MDSDMDLFDDLSTQPAVTRGRAGGKLQPRAKSWQTKETTDVVGVESEESSSISKSAREDNALPASHSIDAEAGGEYQPLVKMPSERETSALESVSQPNTLKEQCAVQSSPDAGAIELVIPIDEANKSINPVGESTAEVDSMGVHIDPFGDILPDPAASNTRAGTKFQPRAKARPRKGTSMAIASAVSNITAENATTQASIVSDNISAVGDNELVNSLTSPLISTERIGMGNTGSHLIAIDNPSAEVMIGDLDSGMGTSLVENADIFLGLECIDEAITQATSGTDISAPVPNEKGLEEKFNIDAKDSFNYLACMEGDVATMDPVQCEAVVQKDYRNSQLEGSGAFHDLDNPEHFHEAATESDAAEHVFSPPMFVSSETEGSEIHVDEEQLGIAEALCFDSANAVHSQDASEVSEKEISAGRKRTSSIMHLSQRHKPSSVADETSKDGKTSRQLTEQATGQLVDEPECDGTESPSAHVADIEDYDYEPAVDENGEDDVCRLENASKKRQASMKAKKSVSNKEKPVRKCKKAKGTVEQTTQECSEKFSLDRLPEDEAHDNDGAESPSSHVAHGEGYDYEPASKEKKASVKSKQPVADKEKPVRKRKRGSGAVEQTTQERPKKFSHSTRRNRRRVNKELLDMPEDEIDFQRLPIRDIILLAEHKERLAIKEAKTLSSTAQRTDNMVHVDDSRNEDDAFALEQNEGYTDEQTYTQQPSLSLFNHHSFMNKAPAARWSKQDTELFYEAVRHFGTDLSMIQQLFPGRTRHAIKLKFKKEERQHPLRFRDAQSHRSTDYSFYKKVIERLQDTGPPADQDPKIEGSISATDYEEADLDAETNEQVAKSEVDEDVAAEDQETYVNEVHDTMQHEEINDDDFGDVWDSYKSEF